jgi:anthranilate synthase component I
MFKQLTYDEFSTNARTHKRIAVYKEIIGDQLTPTNVVLALQNNYHDLTLLESSPKEVTHARYSHLGFDAIATIQSYGDKVNITCQTESQTIEADPFDLLRQYKTLLYCKTLHPLSGYIGGLVGFISYDAIRLIENIPDNNPDMHHCPDMLFRSYTNNITFDHQTNKIVITTVAEINDDVENSYQQAMQRIDKFINHISQRPASTKQKYFNTTASQISTQVDIDDQHYCQMVNEAKKNIEQGDIFQVVLSRQFNIKITATPFDIYRALRFSNPSPYMFYIEADDYAITGASPEKLISIKNNTIESCPLAGTRARGQRPDDVLSDELLHNEKEIAEHMMLVDLARNDLGKVAVPGTVAVTKLKQIEKYSRVMHISSTIQAQLKQNVDVFDAIKASLTAGTLSGAPKIRAMELIDQLETSKRGIYGGTVCGIDSEGNLDSCIIIRTALIKDGVASVRAGAGIVYDSNPQSEADETRHKAQAIIDGIQLAEGANT